MLRWRLIQKELSELPKHDSELCHLPLPLLDGVSFEDENEANDAAALEIAYCESLWKRMFKAMRALDEHEDDFELVEVDVGVDRVDVEDEAPLPFPSCAPSVDVEEDKAFLPAQASPSPSCAPWLGAKGNGNWRMSKSEAMSPSSTKSSKRKRKSKSRFRSKSKPELSWLHDGRWWHSKSKSKANKGNKRH